MHLEIEISQEFEKIRMTLYKNGIMNVVFKKDSFIEMEDLSEVLIWVDSLGKDKKYLNLMEAENNSQIDAEVRSFAASKEENKHTIADGFVMTSQAHKLISNFYMKFNKPAKPSKIFTDRNKAIQWLLEQKELYYQNS